MRGFFLSAPRTLALKFRKIVDSLIECGEEALLCVSFDGLCFKSKDPPPFSQCQNDFYIYRSAFKNKPPSSVDYKSIFKTSVLYNYSKSIVDVIYLSIKSNSFSVLISLSPNSEVELPLTPPIEKYNKKNVVFLQQHSFDIDPATLQHLIMHFCSGAKHFTASSYGGSQMKLIAKFETGEITADFCCSSLVGRKRKTREKKNIKFEVCHLKSLVHLLPLATKCRIILISGRILLVESKCEQISQLLTLKSIITAETEGGHL